ncbi:MAG: sugar transferase, partial [Hydrogenobaculum sp.]
SFEERLKLDTWYVLNWSLWFDIVIILKTIRVVFKKEGAY